MRTAFPGCCTGCTKSDVAQIDCKIAIQSRCSTSILSRCARCARCAHAQSLPGSNTFRIRGMDNSGKKARGRWKHLLIIEYHRIWMNMARMSKKVARAKNNLIGCTSSYCSFAQVGLLELGPHAKKCMYSIYSIRYNHQLHWGKGGVATHCC